MNDLERDAARLLAAYAKDERPPVDLDERILAYLHEETDRREETRRLTKRQWTLVALAAAAVLLLWLLAAFETLGQQAPSAGSTAVHGQASDDPMTSTARAPKGPATRRPDGPDPLPPVDTPEVADADDPGVASLRAARDLMRAGRYTEAVERLDPCSETVGTDDLGEECEFLVIEALCRAGEGAEARRRIAVLRRGRAAPLHLEKIARSCPR